MAAEGLDRRPEILLILQVDTHRRQGRRGVAVSLMGGHDPRHDLVYRVAERWDTRADDAHVDLDSRPELDRGAALPSDGCCADADQAYDGGNTDT